MEAPLVMVRPEAVLERVRRFTIGDGFPIVFDLGRSRGSWVVDARDGRELLDCYTFFASLPLGFHHPAFESPSSRERLLAAALHKPANSDAYTAELASFMESFARHAVPPPFRHLFFIEGGALAVENALKTAFDWKVRRNLSAGKGPLGSQVIHFRQAFHGRSGYTLSLTNTVPVKTLHFPRFDWPRITNPKLRFPVDGSEVRRVAEEERQALAEIESAFDRHGDDIAAIIIEPIQGEGGDNHFRGEFLQALRAVADRREALLIFDEVQTGFGLTGRMWAGEHFGVVPDLLCFGKKAQVCGLMAGPRVDEVEDNVFRVSSRLNSTWGGNLTDMVRCQIVLEVMQRERLVENAAVVGRFLLEGLEDLCRRHHRFLSNARGRGLMCAFDCPDGAARDALRLRAVEEGLLVLGCGERSIRLRPSLTFSQAETAEAVSRLDRAVRALAR